MRATRVRSATAETGADCSYEANSGRVRVLMVTPRFFPEIGGIETHTYEVAKRLARLGDYEVTVLTTDRSGELPIRDTLDGFVVLRCRAYPRHKDYYIAPRLYRAVLAGNYDLMHCQGIHTAVPVIAMCAALRRRLRYVVSFHTGGHSSALRRRLRTAQWRALAPLVRRAAALVAVSRFECRLFQQACGLGEADIRVIQNGGDLTVSAAGIDPVPARIVSSGRLESYKGHQRVVAALPIIQKSVPNATLHILGSGPYEVELRSQVARLGLEDSVQIEHIAPDNRSRMAESLAAAEVFAALSDYEAHPVAVMEALSLGIPTVGLNIAGIADLVADGMVTGVPEDASAATIAQALVEAMDAGRADGKPSLPTWDIAAEKLAEMYIEVMEADRKIRG